MIRSKLLGFLVAELVLLGIALGIGLFTGDNDAASHSAIVFLILFINNYLLCSFGCVDIDLDLGEDALILDGEELVKCVGVNESLYRTAEADVDVVALASGNDALAEGLMSNLYILKNHIQIFLP